MTCFVSLSLTSISWAKPRKSAKKSRLLGVKVNLGADRNFLAKFKESLQVGNQTQVVPQDWNEIETMPGQFRPKTNFFAIANHFYSVHKMPIHISLRPIHTNQNVFPADLVGKPIDAPQTIKRFKKLLDWVATQVPNVQLVSLAIGSEIDLYAWGDTKRWNAWINFYAAVAPYARKKFPGTLITCETSYAAFRGRDLERLRRLHQHSDAIAVSYYPMKNRLRGVKSPKVVHSDFETVVSAIPTKPIFYYQIGYPTSSQLGSSPARQALFITETFRAWDKHANRIRMLNFQWMHETPDKGLDHFAKYYQNHTPEFRAFLGSLGLQSWSGAPKPAWAAIKKEAKARGFAHVK